ncbi:aminopeptidase C [Eremococcus coleocola]|uniref:Aminopeptidase n=1 Tax=Eremococcus coleocola ACS-139-V-Col8 TaxID=908337 RepID=E4KQA6_9LACT|nr:C1 family peptidase [Eremococcus coleocola]EFR30855.1 peptidase C1-like family [Eremococcus coleocola ACS-139-V-Col8]
MTIDKVLLEKLAKQYQADPVNTALAGAVAKVGINDAALNNETIKKHSFVFSDETERGKITNQKSSGRCWMFAALNTARVDTMAKLNLETFEFSQNYTLFWDKLEKANYFLDSIIETVDESLSGRLVQHLLMAPLQDGGQWDMFAGILKKYGAVPKAVMPETFHSSNTNVLVSLLTGKLREFAKTLRDAHQAGQSKADLEALKEDMLAYVYNVLVKALGQVPETFTYEFRDKDKNFHRIENITPQDFFKEYVAWDLDDRISLINAPTSDKPFGKAYTVKFLGTIKEAKEIRYINVPMEELKGAAIKAIQAGHPVWFGCDVGKLSERQKGIMDLDIYNYDQVIGGYDHLDKAGRLDYGQSLLTHAMVLVGVDLDADGNAINWKVENSWGEKVGDKGIFSMSDAWMDEFTYQIAVPSEFVSPDYLKALNGDVIELEPWDPMGALAMVK